MAATNRAKDSTQDRIFALFIQADTVYTRGFTRGYSLGGTLP